MRDDRDGGSRRRERRNHGRDRLDDIDIQAELEDYFDQGSPDGARERHIRDPKSSRSRHSPSERDRYRRRDGRGSRSPSTRSRSRDRYSRPAWRDDMRSRSPGRGGERYRKEKVDLGVEYSRDRKRDRYDVGYQRDREDHRRDEPARDKGYRRHEDKRDRRKDTVHERRETKENYRRDTDRYGSSRRDGDHSSRHVDYDQRKRNEHVRTAERIVEDMPPPPPPVEIWPRSPDISKELASLARSQDLSYDPTKGIQDSGLLNSRLSHMESVLLGPTIQSWSDQEEQCRLICLKVGVFGKHEEEKEPFSKDMLPEYIPESAVLPIRIPYNPDGAVKDPRSDFQKEYDLMAAWAMKTRTLPGFADQSLDHDTDSQSPTHSWSTSPKQIASNLARNKQIAHQQEDHHIAARSASLPLDFTKNKHVDAKADEQIELEEGYFNVKLLNGEECALQYGEIVDLIKKGELPNGWPAFRDVDSLWVSVSTGEETESIKQEKHERPLEGTGGGSRPLVEELATEDIESIHSWIMEKSRLAETALQSKTHPSILQYARGKPLSFGTEEHRDFDFKEEAKIASESLSNYEHIIAMRRQARILSGTRKPVDPTTMAMVKGYILDDRAKLRDIATGALQKALKSFLTEQKSKPTGP